MRQTLLLALLLISPAVVVAQSVSVSDAMTINSSAGEAQSTVVPPKLKSQCMDGRFLVTNDGLRPPDPVVSGRNLNETSGTPVASVFKMGTLKYDADPAKTSYTFGTNDHDLITLSNGDVLYVTGAFSKMPVNPGGRPLPIWMSWLLDQTFRGGFGPDARSVVLVFRSTDCGENFEFLSEMDPLRFSGATCGLPQFRRDANSQIISAPPYDMGGTDGQLTKVDPANDNLYMTFQCVGYLPDDTSKLKPLLDPAKKINKTLVLMSDSAGATWKSLGYIDQAAWRFGIVPMANGELDFGFASSVLTGKKSATGSYTFDSTGVVAPSGSWSWMGWWDFTGKPGVLLTKNQSNVFGMPLVTRTRDSKGLVLAFPDNFGAQGYGYRVFFYDRAKATLAEATSILPAKAGTNNFAFHLAAADPGSGPVLLYWSDLDSSAKEVAVRGRLITGTGEFSDDFTVSRSGGSDHSFPLPANYWLGDYHTAGAVIRKTGQVMGQGKFTLDMRTTRFDYYPIWIEADNSVHYAKVEYAVDPALLTAQVAMKAKPVKLTTIPAAQWRPQPQPIELRSIKRPLREVTREDDRREQGPIRRPVRPRP